MSIFNNSDTNVFKAYKWISYSNKSLQIHPISNIFQHVSQDPCNLISIFGKARQGKSFLMNCLAGETEIFRISNEKDSCTQGIDISDKWLSLVDFSTIDRGKAISFNKNDKISAKMKVGFVDAEGQGDKDINYDTQLICPILLTSKCVIFNWKGDLQKDHILVTLGIMARSGRNISVDVSNNNKTTTKFGHLHIIFRDWQAVNTHEADVYDTIMTKEGTTESNSRDLIRHELLLSFESIRIWLFDPPSEYTKDLKQVLTFEKTSQTFRTQVRKLREVLSLQLKEPLVVAGNTLTGRTYAPLTQQIAHSLNSGGVVLPSSAYLNMMRDEALVFRTKFEHELKESVTTLLATIHQRGSTVTARTTNSKVPLLYMRKAEALSEYSDLYSAINTKYKQNLYESMGGCVGGALVETVVAEFQAFTKQINIDMLQNYSALYQQQFNQWLQLSRQAAEKTIESDMKAIELKLPMAEQSDKADTVTTVVETLSHVMNDVYAKSIACIGGVAYYGSDCKEVADAENILTRYYSMLATKLKEMNTNKLVEVQKLAKKYYNDALKSMDIRVEETFMKFDRIAMKSGYNIKSLQDNLNEQYYEIKKQLLEQIKVVPDFQSILDTFDDYCKSLHGEKVLHRYKESKEKALLDSIRSVDTNLQMVLEHYDLTVIWTNDNDNHQKTLALENSLQQLSKDIQNNALNAVIDWLSDDKQEQKDFLANVTSVVSVRLQTYYDHIKQQLQQQLEQEEEEEDNTIVYSDDDDDDDDEDSNVSQSLNNGTTNKTAGSSSKALLSAEEQRQKAKDWAQKQLGLNLNNKKRHINNNKHTKTSSIGSMKSIEQQRADALLYAKNKLNVDGTSPPNSYSTPRNHIDSDDNNSIAASISSNTSTNSTTNTTTTTNVKVDVLKLAKEQAKKQQEERTKAAAEAAVARLTNKKVKK